MIGDQEVEKLTIYPNLQQVDLRGNKIKNFETLGCFSKLNRLEQIDLRGNIFCDKVEDNPYHMKLFYMYLIIFIYRLTESCPLLNIIDSYRRDGTIISDS
jgi:hypothetical protein